MCCWCVAYYYSVEHLYKSTKSNSQLYVTLSVAIPQHTLTHQQHLARTNFAPNNHSIVVYFSATFLWTESHLAAMVLKQLVEVDRCICKYANQIVANTIKWRNMMEKREQHQSLQKERKTIDRAFGLFIPCVFSFLRFHIFLVIFVFLSSFLLPSVRELNDSLLSKRKRNYD